MLETDFSLTPIEQTVQCLSERQISVTILRGLNCASESLKIQKEFFRPFFPFWDHYHKGSINLQLKEQLPKNMYYIQLPLIKWTVDWCSESFRFVPARLVTLSQIVKGWLYMPSATPHKQNNIVEFVGPWLEIENNNCTLAVTTLESKQ